MARVPCLFVIVVAGCHARPVNDAITVAASFTAGRPVFVTTTIHSETDIPIQDRKLYETDKVVSDDMVRTEMCPVTTGLVGHEPVRVRFRYVDWYSKNGSAALDCSPKRQDAPECESNASVYGVSFEAVIQPNLSVEIGDIQFDERARAADFRLTPAHLRKIVVGFITSFDKGTHHVGETWDEVSNTAVTGSSVSARWTLVSMDDKTARFTKTLPAQPTVLVRVLEQHVTAEADRRTGWLRSVLEDVRGETTSGSTSLQTHMTTSSVVEQAKLGESCH